MYKPDVQASGLFITASQAAYFNSFAAESNRSALSIAFKITNDRFAFCGIRHPPLGRFDIALHAGHDIWPGSGRMLVWKRQRVTLRTVALRHQIARLGTFKRIALSRSLPAATAQQQDHQYNYARQFHFQFPLAVYKKIIITAGFGWNVRTNGREIYSGIGTRLPLVALPARADTDDKRLNDYSFRLSR